MKSDEDEVVLQGVEFWSSVCDEEIDLSIEAQEAEENGTTPQTFSRFYAKGALQYLAPLLLEILTKQEEHDDEEDWTPHKAAGVCLMLLASCCANCIIPHVLPFIETNIMNNDWKYRDAAVMAFGKNSFLPGVHECLRDLVEEMRTVHFGVHALLGGCAHGHSHAYAHAHMQPLTALHTHMQHTSAHPCMLAHT